MFLFIASALTGQVKKDSELELIVETLKTFKQGYAERDTSKAADWGHSILYDNVEVLGTYSIHPNGLEWLKGRERAIKVFKSDWLHWGDLDVKLETANIDHDENLAWVSFEAVVTRSSENSRSRTAEQSMGNIFRHINSLSEEDDGRTNKLKLMEAAYYANLILYQYEQGDVFIWPLRVTGVLQKKNGIWKFRQIHISHPNRGFPNVRNSNK